MCDCQAFEQQQCSAAQCSVGQTEADHSSVAMLTLASKLKRDDGGKTGRATGASDSTHRVSIRDRLLTKGTRGVHGPLGSSLCCIEAEQTRKINILGLTM